MTSAVASSCAATEDCGSPATFIVVARSWAALTIGVPFWTSFLERDDVVNGFSFESVLFFPFGNVKWRDVRQNQQWMTQYVAVIQVPEVCETSTLLERVSRDVRALGRPQGTSR